MEWITVAKSSVALNSHALLLFILVSAISGLLLRKAISGRTKQWPPGPPAWPIIGHLHLLGDLPHQSLFKLSQRYGPLMGLHLGGIPTIIASSQDMAKAILQTHDLTFAYRPRLAGAVHLCFNCTDLGFAPYGPYWKFLRQLYASELFSTKRLDASKHVREEEVRTLMRTVLQRGRHGDEGIELRPSLVMASNNINCRMAMGKRITEISARMGSGEDSKLDLCSLIDEVLHLLGVFYVGDFIPWLAWLDPHGYLKRMKAAGQKAKLIMQDMIDKRRESQQERLQDPEDLLDVLLAASQNKDLQDVSITDDNIMAAILDLFIGGSDTSAVTVEWALADLINNPRVMQKMQQEIDNVVGRERLVEEEDIKNLPYLGSVLTESMRLHPSVPLLLPRESIQECHIGGYKIPSKSRAFINTWAMGRDAATWEKPLDFWPERFDGKSLDPRGQIFEMLAFGLGRRKCPGWALGLLNVHFMLATLVQGFSWSVESPRNSNNASHMHTLLDMSEKFGLTVSMAKPLHAFALPRLPLLLYDGTHYSKN